MVAAIALCGVAGAALPGHAQPAQSAMPPALTGSVRTRVIDSVVKQLRARYVLPDSLERAIAALQRNLRAGRYDSLTQPGRFANTVSADMYAAIKDGHLALRYDPEFERRLTAMGFASAASRADPPATPDDLVRFRRMNFGVPETRILDGNVGYVRVTQWVDLQYSRPTLAAAMAFVANCDALIIDVRNNPGGYRNAVNFVTSHLVGPGRTELMTRVSRDTTERERFFTDPASIARGSYETPLFVLTNENSGSGSEVFAYQIQALRRGTTVGRTTAGDGYGNLEAPVGHGFVLYISTFRHEDPQSHHGFQGVGVKPDVESPSATALERAHTEALRGLSVAATDSSRRRSLTWLAASVDAQARGARPLRDDERAEILGSYDGSLTIAVVDGQLTFTGVSKVTHPLVALSDGTFEVADRSIPIESRVRVQFDPPSAGASPALTLLVADGRRFRRARTASRPPAT